MDLKDVMNLKASDMSDVNGFYPIFTSCYDYRKEIQGPYRGISISIDCFNSQMEQLLSVAPDEYILQYYKKEALKDQRKAEEIFKDIYRQRIKELYLSGELAAIAKKLVEYSKESPVVLFSSEKPEEFSHRQLLAKTLNSFFSLGIAELVTYDMVSRWIESYRKEKWDDYNKSKSDIPKEEYTCSELFSNL